MSGARSVAGVGLAGAAVVYAVYRYWVHGQEGESRSTRHNAPPTPVSGDEHERSSALSPAVVGEPSVMSDPSPSTSSRKWNWKRIRRRSHESKDGKKWRWKKIKTSKKSRSSGRQADKNTDDEPSISRSEMSTTSAPLPLSPSLSSQQPPQSQPNAAGVNIGAGDANDSHDHERDDSSGSEDNSALCVVCLDHPSNTGLSPCGHVAACDLCAKKLKDCPMCRTAIKSRLRLYF